MISSTIKYSELLMKYLANYFIYSKAKL